MCEIICLSFLSSKIDIDASVGQGKGGKLRLNKQGVHEGGGDDYNHMFIYGQIRYKDRVGVSFPHSVLLM